MRHAVMHLHHQLTETAVHAIAHRLDRANIGNRTTTNFFPGLGVMIGRSDRLDDDRAESAVAPRHPTQRMIVPEDRADIRIDPEPLPHELDRHDIPAGCAFRKGR